MEKYFSTLCVLKQQYCYWIYIEKFVDKIVSGSPSLPQIAEFEF